MRLYAPVDGEDPEAIDVYLSKQDAQRALEDCLRDERVAWPLASRGDRAPGHEPVAELTGSLS
jgi:hypothetical protein